MAHRVRLGVFSPSVLLGVAAATGALERAGLRVEEVPATSSTEQLAALLAGRLDAVLTSPDNVLARPDAGLAMLAAIDRGLGLSLFTAPGAGLGDLPGGVLAVDVATSGFALVGYELLARVGLRAGRDYEVRAWGTTPRRAAALIAGDCTMSVLNAGSDLRAEAAGCTRVSRACTLGPYVGTVLAVAEPGTPQLALTAALLDTSGALVDGRLDSVAAEVAAARLGLDPDGVRRHLATLADPAEGLIPGGRLDPAALATLRGLRARHAPSIAQDLPG